MNDACLQLKSLLITWLMFSGQIFVNIAYMNVQAHTAGYAGLQVCLFLVTFQNVLFILDTGIAYNFFCDRCGGPSKRRRNTKMLSILYLIATSIVFAAQSGVTFYFVLLGRLPSVASTEIVPGTGTTIMTVLSKLGMVFIAVIPVYISYKRSKADYPIDIYIKQRVEYDNDDDEETTPLR